MVGGEDRHPVASPKGELRLEGARGLANALGQLAVGERLPAKLDRRFGGRKLGVALDEVGEVHALFYTSDAKLRSSERHGRVALRSTGGLAPSPGQGERSQPPSPTSSRLHRSHGASQGPLTQGPKLQDHPIVGSWGRSIRARWIQAW